MPRAPAIMFKRPLRYLPALAAPYAYIFPYVIDEMPLYDKLSRNKNGHRRRRHAKPNALARSGALALRMEDAPFAGAADGPGVRTDAWQSRCAIQGPVAWGHGGRESRQCTLAIRSAWARPSAGAAPETAP